MTGIAPNFSSQLGTWPSDCIGQQQYIDRLRQLLTNTVTYFNSLSADAIYLKQDIEPTQLEWEAAWLAQTSKSLPISAGGTLLWWDTVSGVLGGVYGTVVGSGIVYKRENSYVKGSAYYIGSDVETTTITGLTSAILANGSIMPSLTFYIPTACNLDIYCAVPFAITAGTPTLGIDAVLDGVKLGSEAPYSFNPNRGVVEGTANGILTCRLLIPSVAAGTYTVRPAFGLANGTSGTYSVYLRSIIVKAFIE